MPHEDYVPAPPTPDHTFDPATLYQTQPLVGRPAVAKPPEAPRALSPRLAKAGFALVLAGAIGVLIGQHRLARANATRGWAETTAIISSAKLHGGGSQYHLDLAYRYRAGPKERQGARIALEPRLTRDAAYAYAERFRPGARVPAWFDPAAPESVVLERPDIPAPWAPTLLGAALIIAGLVPFGAQLFRHLRYRLELRRAALVV